MTTITLLQQALDALEEATAYTSSPSWSPSMTEECTAVAASIRAHLAAQPAHLPVPLTGHVYLVQYGTKCLEAFADLSAAVAYAYNIGSHAYVACVAVRTPEYVTHVFGIAASPEKKP